MKKIDCIVIGAGNGGLVAALTLQKQGKKVVLLEKGSSPGGVSSSFRRGRFEFDASPYELVGYDSSEEFYSFLKRFEILNKIDFCISKEALHIIEKETKEEYTFPIGMENFIQKMEEYVPESTNAMTTFFGLCEDIREALSYIRSQKGTIDEKDLYQKYPNFVQLAPCKVDTVLEKIQMPKKAMDLLSTFWLLFGSPTDDLSFVHFSSIVYPYICYGPCIPEYTSHEMSRILEQEFKNLGGTIFYRTEAKEILVEDQMVTGVKTNHDTYSASHVLANISPKVVYGSMIDSKNVPEENAQLENERILGPRTIIVYLGLNAPITDIKLTHYSYTIVNQLNSKAEYKNMQEIFHGNLRGVVPNVINENASVEGTSVLILTSLIYGDGFDKLVTKENYFEVKEQLSDYLVRTFEESTGISIREYIEEVEVATPLTFARYTGHPGGTIYGYMAKGYDNILPRMFSEEEETRIKGLRFSGCFGTRLSSWNETYFNGEEEAMKMLGEWES